MVIWRLLYKTHCMLQIQQLIPIIEQLQHVIKKLQTVGHGFNFHEMEPATFGKQECPLMIHM